jgi:hypothetical protein
MGALLLLLFIMDRRAKIAARNQVSEAYSKRKARDKAEEDARSAEWEKARAALQQSLLATQGDLHADTQAVKNQLDDVNKKAQAIQARHGDLQRKLDSENAKIASLHSQIALQQTGLSQAAKEATASKAELAAAEKDLLVMELAFQHLRALKDRDQKTYSVVPYRGKQGDARPPIYVECVRDGVLIHPEKKLLETWAFTTQAIREEIERRHGPLTLERAAKDDADKGPYVLFLVRPDGIANYYKAQSALKGYHLDFGYELVDQHWVLDFDSKRDGPKGTLAKEAPVERAPILGMHPSNAGDGNAGSGQSMMPLPIGAGGPLNAPRSNVGFGNPQPTGPITLPRTEVVNPSQGGGPSFTPVTKLLPLVPVTPAGKSGAGVVNPSQAPPAGSVGSQSSPEKKPSPVSNLAPSPNPGVKPFPASGLDANKTSPNDESSSSSGVKPFPSLGSDVERKAAAPPTPRIAASKDFVITVECRGEAVTINPGGQVFRWTDKNEATDEALVKAVASLVSRRQASVRPGESPYRPVIRFQVSPEGLRTYYHVYPLLEALRLPMTRENVQE